MQQQFEFIKTLSLCLAFVGLVLVQIFWPLFKIQTTSHKFKNILSFSLIRNLFIALSFFVCIFILALKNAFPSPSWAIPFSIVFLDFIAYFWHFLSHRWRTGNYFHSDDSLAHLTDVWQSVAPRLVIVWVLRLPVEGLIFFEMAIVGGYLLEIGLSRCPAWVERTLSSALMTPKLVAHHYTMVKGRSSRKNFGIVFSLWDRIFGTYRASQLPKSEVITANLR